MSGNISFGENSFTNTAAKAAKKAEELKPKKEEVKNGPSPLVVLEKLKKEQEKVLAGMEDFYEQNPSNPISVAINSIEMTLLKIDVAIDDEKRFGK